MPHPGARRAVRSFVLRAGRLTEAQQRALRELMPRYGLDLAALAEPAAAFGRRAPLRLEIGIGNGDSLEAMARRWPDRDFLGCDVHRPGLGRALRGLHEAGLENVRLVEADAVDVLTALGDAALDAVYLFFPDPWPKKRHHKRRLLDPALLELLARKLAGSGSFYFATDDAGYAEAAREAIDVAAQWLNLAGPLAWAPRPRFRPVTRFEARARAASRPVFELLAALRSP